MAAGMVALKRTEKTSAMLHMERLRDSRQRITACVLMGMFLVQCPAAATVTTLSLARLQANLLHDAEMGELVKQSRVCPT